MEQVRGGYGTLAERYIELFGSIAEVHVDDLALINRHLAIRPGGTVLDVGCGPGHITAYLNSLNVDATGIELVPEFIAHARATYPDSCFELGSFRQLAVPDRTIAGMLVWYSLIHVPPGELDEVLAKLRRASSIIAKTACHVAIDYGHDVMPGDPPSRPEAKIARVAELTIKAMGSPEQFRHYWGLSIEQLKLQNSNSMWKIE